MSKKFLTLVAVMVCVAVWLMYRASQTGTSNVFTPSDLMAMGQEARVERLRVVGRISAAIPIQYQTEPYAELKFAIENPPAKPAPAGMAAEIAAQTNIIRSAAPNSPESMKPLAVVYKGLKPDMFVAGRDVIIDGSLESGTVVAGSLLTQCPSKYEAPSPEKKYPLDGKASNADKGA